MFIDRIEIHNNTIVKIPLCLPQAEFIKKITHLGTG